MTAEFVLISSLCVYILANNVPVVLTGVPYRQCRSRRCCIRGKSVRNLSVRIVPE
jgi:hypothetical protein